MNTENIQDIYPLSPMQQGMLFHTIYSPELGAYVEQTEVEISGALNKSAFVNAWQAVVDRNPILRTCFIWENVDEPLQVVFKQVELPVVMEDWRGKSGEMQKKDLEQFLLRDRKSGFNLTSPPLMRLALLQIADDRLIMVWTHHHLLLDGWSQPLLMQELFSCYYAFDSGKPIEYAERPPFKNYIEWLQQQNMSSAESFWAQEMSGFTAPTPLPGARILKESSAASDYTTAQQLLSPELTANLREFSRQTGLTLNTLLQGAWALLLSRYSNEEDIVFGSVVSGRPPELSGADQMIGLFINTLPVRIFINDESTISEWLQAIQKKQVESRRFEYSSLVNIKSWSRLTANRSLFDTIFVFESYPVDDSMKNSEHAIRIGEQNHFSRTNYPLTFVCSPGKQIGLQIAYETNRFQSERIDAIISQVGLILEKMIALPQAQLKHLTLISAADFEQIILEWNKTSAPLPKDLTIPQLFDQAVKKFAQEPALFFDEKSLTYHELDQVSNQMARFLLAKGVKTEDLIAVCMDRSLDMVITLLAILKAGCACVPIDPYYPQERIRLLLEESQAALVLTQSSMKADLASSSKLLIAIDEQKETIEGFGMESVDVHLEPENLAYVIFTSGSTGRPKGTLVPHRGVCNFKDFGGKEFAGDPKSRILQFSSFSFDASMGEIFKALLNGGTLYLAPRSVLLSVDELSDFLVKHRINYVTLAPSLLSQLDPRKVTSLSTVISVGEACSWELVKRWSSGRSFLNGYGPTETTIGATIGLLQENIYETSSPPIGRPAQNIQVYILDPFLNPLPVGLTGQIFIGGIGVTRGYLNRPDLTADRFLPNPFLGKGERMYKTGDLGKFTSDGQLVFEGRADFQVKLRGFRIELGEIEAQLEEIESINKAVVIVREDTAGDKRLAAYVAPHGGKEINVPQIVATLKEKMPDYMVPAAFVVLEIFPLTPNGKVDRKALPAPDQSGYILTEYVAPRTPTEELITAIFQDVLHNDRVSINDDFFNLGGHSLLATQLVSRLRDAFSVDLSLQDVFATPTVADLALKLNDLKAQGFGLDLPLITPQPRDGDLPLSFAQQRLWFLDQLQPNSPFYNIPIALKLEGELNIPALKKSFDALIQRHESLRTTFISDEGRPFQRIDSDLAASFEEHDLSQLKLDDQTAQINDMVQQEAIQPFYLDEGPLLRIVLVKLSPQKHVLLFTLHHIISDGWSVNLLVRDVVQYYQAFISSQPPQLPELPIQYADFSIWQRQILQGDYLEKQLSYWRQTLVGVPPMLELPTDYPRPRMQTFNGATLSRTLSREISNAVNAFSRREGVTPFMTLFAVFASILYRYSRQNDFNIGTPIANRNRMETEGLIGFFVNNLVLRCRFDQNPTFLEFLQSVRSNALDAYAHQDIPFEMLVEQLHPQRDLSHSPLFQVVFVFQNTPMSKLSLPELQIEPLDNETLIAKFDLSLEAAETANGLFFQLEYNTDLFHSETANRLLHHLELFLRNALLEPERRISEIEFIPEGEERLLLRDWNQSDVPFDSSQCAHQVFERHVAESPDKIAVTHGDSQLTYSEVNQRANQLARYLKKQGCKSDDLVGISVRRSIEQVIAILATLKAGCAFVPIDPTYPQDRIAYMLEDSAISLLLTQKEIVDTLPVHAAAVFCLDADGEVLREFSGADLKEPVSSANLAYVIYTSGSTGKPKGAMLQHQGMINLAAAQKKAFHIKPDMRILQFAPMSFDASVWETIMALLNGATLCLADQESLATGDGLLAILQNERINVVTLPPSVLSIVPQTPLPHLHTIITAGEKCTADLVDRWMPGREYFNAYGPTETTVCASMHLCDGQYPQGPPIGRPIDNAKLYILDAHLQITPIGVGGELCVGGPSLARGYLKRPDLTAEKFIPNPFDNNGGRLYRTGDLARYLPDGNIEFLGRIDHQVKVRGFRIELGEIETVLSSHPAVKNVIVLAKQMRAEDTRLVAYVVVDAAARPLVNDLRAFVSRLLPDYMTPSFFMILDEMPLTPSGKIDRHALPEPDMSRPDLQVEYVAPRNETEEKLVHICIELLRINQVGVLDNFFDLGGHSLLATQFMSRMRDQFGIDLPLRVLFEKPTVEGLALAIEEAKLTAPHSDVPTITAVSREGKRRKLSDIQQNGVQ